MQQTEKYQFNLIEPSDTFSPDPLNENMEKVEAALYAETAARQAADAAEAAARAALDSRLTVQEGYRYTYGTYAGTGDPLVVEVGFTPRIVIVNSYQLNYGQRRYIGSNGYAQIVENGFQITDSCSLNLTNHNYNYIALL